MSNSPNLDCMPREDLHAKRKSKADKGAFTWRVSEAHTRQFPVATYLSGTVHA